MTDLIKMWHGGKFDEYEEIQIKHSRTGKTFNGPGIYTTNDLNTASDYAKGGRSIYYMGIDPNMNLLENSKVPYQEVIDFVENSSGMRHKKEILSDLDKNYERMKEKNGEGIIDANVLLNLMVNYDVCKGEHGPNLANFYKEKNIQASLMKGKNGGEEWLLIFDPKVIKEKRVFSKKELSKDWNSWSYDTVTSQLSQNKFKTLQSELNNEIKIAELPKSIREELFNNHAMFTQPDAIQKIFDFKKLPIKTIDLTKIDNGTLYDMPKSSVDTYIKSMNEDKNLSLCVIADNKLIDGMHRITSLIKNGVKELKVVDATGVVDSEQVGYITEVTIKENNKNTLKSKNKIA